MKFCEVNDSGQVLSSSTANPLYEVLDFFGMTNQNRDQIIYMNDRVKSDFYEIANYIENDMEDVNG